MAIPGPLAQGYALRSRRRSRVVRLAAEPEMRENSRSGLVLLTSLLIGGAIGAATQILTPGFEEFLGVSPVVVFGLGIGVVEGPTLVTAIVLCRRVQRAWVRNALQAAAPFVGFFAYLVAYGILRHPPFSFPTLDPRLLSLR